MIPTPEWKEKNFPGDPWRIGNTYHASIGQYGFLVTPLQALRATAAIANNGTLPTPTILVGASPTTHSEELPFRKEHLQIAREGMRLAVTEGTAKGLNIPEIPIAAKTGTAELGLTKAYVNSWVVGFFPYEKPRYAFVVLMEKGDVHNTLGGVYVMRQMFEWMYAYARDYVES